MSSQPANASIQVHRRIRAKRNDSRHDSVKSLLSPGLREHVMVVPGEEVKTLASRDASSSSDRYYNGHRVVISNRAVKTMAATVTAISGLEMPIKIGRDNFLEKTRANVGDDLHAELRAV